MDAPQLSPLLDQLGPWRGIQSRSVATLSESCQERGADSKHLGGGRGSRKKCYGLVRIWKGSSLRIGLTDPTYLVEIEARGHPADRKFLDDALAEAVDLHPQMTPGVELRKKNFA